MKRLILNADDFGMGRSVNDAVWEAHATGCLTSASLMVNGEAFDEAVAQCRETPSLAVGLHLTLIQGQATLPPSRIPQLADRRGYFSDNPVAAGLRYFFLAEIQSELEAEIRAQIEKFLATGLPLDHLNGHLNIHVHPSVFRILMKVAAEYSIRAIRIPSQPWWFTLGKDPRAFLFKTLHAAAFGPLCAVAAPELRLRGIQTCDRVFGLLDSGFLHEAYFASLIETLPDGVTEIYFHPAKKPCPQFRRWNRGYAGESELGALTSPRARDLLARKKIELASYGGLVCGRPKNETLLAVGGGSGD